MEGNLAAKFLAEMTEGPRTIRIHNSFCTGYRYTDNRPHPLDALAVKDAVAPKSRVVRVQVTFEDRGVCLEATLLAEDVSYEN